MFITIVLCIIGSLLLIAGLVCFCVWSLYVSFFKSEAGMLEESAATQEISEGLETENMLKISKSELAVSKRHKRDALILVCLGCFILLIPFVKMIWHHFIK